MLTLGNLVIGMVAILLASQGGHLNEAALLIVIGMLLDGLDGRAARWLHAESEFGKQLDSLSDMVTFGVAPAFIMYDVILRYIGIIGIILTVLFPICGALRLARFNVQTKSSSFFVGLPITAAGGILSTMALTQSVLHPAVIILPLSMLLLALLMVSNVRYPNFKKVAFPRSAIVLVPAFVVVIFVAIKYELVSPGWIIFGVLAVYAVYGMLRGFMPMPEDDEEEKCQTADDLDSSKSYHKM